MKDGGVRITFDSQELNENQCATLFSLRNSLGWLIFVSHTAPEVEIPDAPPAEFREDKSPSKRLRAVLFVLWKQMGSEGDFENFYKLNMEFFINSVKEKLDEAMA